MSNKKIEKTDIIEIREKSRTLGMSRGRVTRNIEVDKVCDIRHFQLTIILQDEDEAKKQSDFVKMLFSQV